MNLTCEITQSQNSNWYALYTSARAEKKVAQRLKDLGCDFFLPLISVQRSWSARVKIIEVPLFNSYIFVNTTEINLFILLKVHGIVKVIYFNNKPATIQKSDLYTIKKSVQ